MINLRQEILSPLRLAPSCIIPRKLFDIMTTSFDVVTIISRPVYKAIRKT